jgi:predicted RNA-binding protein with PUA-like domain
VDVAAAETFKNPVALSVLKTDKVLKNMQFVRIGRLSVSVVTEEEFNLIKKLSA